MVRRFLVKMVLAASFLLLFSLKFVDVTIGENFAEYPLETAWKATGLPITEIDTETWMRFNSRWMSVYELKNTADQIRVKLELKLKTDIVYGEQGEFNYISFEGVRGDGTVVTVTMQSTQASSGNETQLGLNTIRRGKPNNLKGYLENLKMVITALGPEVHFNVLLQGERKGRISQLMVREISGRAFDKIKAQLVKSAFEEDFSSQKGYTKLFPETISSDYQRVNIEIGTRYDPSRNITQIVMATPALNDGI